MVRKFSSITLPRNVHIDKAVVFPGVMCGCEKWTVSARGRGPQTVELKKTLESPLESREMNKRNQPWLPIRRTDAEVEAPILCVPDMKNIYYSFSTHWKRPCCWERLRGRVDGVTEDELVGCHQWFKVHEFEQTMGDSEGQRSLACSSSWGCKEPDMT